MATIRVKILTNPSTKRRVDGSELYSISALSAESQIARVGFDSQTLRGKLKRGDYVVISGCRITPRDDFLQVTMQESTKVVALIRCMSDLLRVHVKSYK